MMKKIEELENLFSRVDVSKRLRELIDFTLYMDEFIPLTLLSKGLLMEKYILLMFDDLQSITFFLIPINDLTHNEIQMLESAHQKYVNSDEYDNALMFVSNATCEKEEWCDVDCTNDEWKCKFLKYKIGNQIETPVLIDRIIITGIV